MKRLYSIWHNMKSRCYNSNLDKYKHYGGSGISVCDEWKKDFRAFERWALADGLPLICKKSIQERIIILYIMEKERRLHNGRKCMI